VLATGHSKSEAKVRSQLAQDGQVERLTVAGSSVLVVLARGRQAEAGDAVGARGRGAAAGGVDGVDGARWLKRMKLVRR
jgi:hypothetical protein